LKSSQQMRSKQLEICPLFAGKIYGVHHINYANNLSSWVEMLLKDGKAREVRKLLDSDQHLFETIMDNIKSGQEVLSALTAAAASLWRLRVVLQLTPQIPLSAIWVRAALGEIAGSALLRETLLHLKKVSSDKIGPVLAAFKEAERIYLPFSIATYENELEGLLKNTSASAPLRTEDDVRNSTLRMTVVAQKVELSKHKAALSEQDKLYSDLISRLHHDLDDYFSSTFIDPKDLFLSEILIYDLRSPHTEVFQPKPRFAIERALATPHDYLGCDCCGAVGDGKDAQATLSASQPATAILYQLYLESGSLINASDLWSAFHAIVGEENEDDAAKAKTM
jgi:origin recognition complex subunit 3